MLRLTAARYRCTGCGDCCRGWYVPLEPGEAETFRARAAGLVPPERLASAVVKATQAGARVEALAGPGGQCPALAEDQRCLIHAERGGDQKPHACQIFPFTFVATPDEVRVGLSFACPAVVDGEGEPLEEQRAEIEALFARAIDGTRYLLRIGDQVPLASGLMLAWPDARRLLDAIAAALSSGPLLERVARAGALSALTQARLEEGKPFSDAFASAQAEHAALAAEALAEREPIDRLSRAMLRTLLRASEPQRSTAGRVGGIFSSFFGGGAIRLRDGRKLDWTAAGAVAPGLGEEGEALVARRLALAASCLTFFGEAAFGFSISAGLDFLALSAAVAARLARLFAAASSRPRVTPDDVKQALRQLDSGLTHRSTMPRGFDRALAATSSLSLLRAELGGGDTTAAQGT